MAIRKCKHDVYWPEGHAVAFSCQQCNPGGTGAGATPVLPRSSGDPLFTIRTRAVETCEVCGNLRTYFSNNCLSCSTPFPVTELRGREQGTANLHTPGVCPSCNSAVHYETAQPSKWQCAECDTIYTAVKRGRISGEEETI